MESIGLVKKLTGRTSLVVQCFQGRGLEFNPWSGKEDPTCCVVQPKKEKEELTGSLP